MRDDLSYGFIIELGIGEDWHINFVPQAYGQS